jgi:DNA repair protein RadA/Sms
VPLTEVKVTEFIRNATGIEPLDRVLGGGLVLGGSFLISGGPGAGKSTLLSQMLFSAKRPDGAPCERLMWATAEENVAHIAIRAKRIGTTHHKIRAARETNVDRILAHAERFQPEILVVDSIQTILTDEIESVAGSVQQVQECATRLDHFAKATNTCVVLICQVTKDGQSAGPNKLKHLVDVLLSLEVSDEFPALRWLTSSKNRFGSGLETGWFEMRDDGLYPVARPDPREEREAEQDELAPVAQELVWRFLEAGGEIDPGLRERIAGRLDLEPRGSR